MGEDRQLRHRVLEAITDRALMDLDLDKLLDVLVFRVRDLFVVDTVTVLLVDANGEQLVARSTAGFDEEVFQGVRVPIGEGFAGRVAQLRQPVLVERVDESTVVNPLLWEHGLRMLLGVPIVAQEELVGVLHVGVTSPREFSGQEAELLQLVADRVALVAHMHRSRSEQAAAAMLVDSLMPSRLPSTRDWELAARYVAGANTGVGGDWYDVFPLPGDRIGLVIGDVVGSGLLAAIVMGRLRSALRAYALEFDEPAVVLGKLDRKASHFEHRTMATVAYAVIDTAGQRMDFALAGHLPPIIALPDEDAEFVRAPVGPPVGYNLGITGRTGTSIAVPPEALLVFYTDGLVERRGTDLDERLEQLRAAVHLASPTAVCAHLMATMVGGEPATDDIALVAARHTSS